MKKILKVLSLLAISLVLCLGIVAFAACSDKDNGDNGSGTTYTGEYSYESNGNNYGFKVAVTVEDGKITKVERVESNFVEVTSALPNYGWTQDKVDNWNNEIDNLLKAYEGKTVEEILAATSTISGVGEDTTNTVSDSDLVITDATQGSARVLRAVQNALSKMPKTYTGEYHYNANSNEYGIKVAVTVEDGKITKVEKVASDYVEVTSALPNYGWTQDKVDEWNNNIDDLLKAYEGKTVAEVLAATSTISGVGEDETNTVSDSDLVISGATQGSARVLRAVQAALADLAD